MRLMLREVLGVLTVGGSGLLFAVVPLFGLAGFRAGAGAICEDRATSTISVP